MLISIKISLKFVLKGPINIIPVLIQIMAWRRSGDKPLSEQIMVILLHIFASLGLNELTLWYNTGYARIIDHHMNQCNRKLICLCIIIDHINTLQNVLFEQMIVNRSHL